GILSVFFTAGFPTVDDTQRIAEQLQASGVDMIEIGIPFSDPVADGPVIQESNTRALANGMTLKTLLSQVKQIRAKVNIPILLMGYLNPVIQYGVEKFCVDFAAAGIDGVILPDLPADVFQREYQALFHEYGLKNVFLISPTTSDERIRKIDTASAGFIYAVSSSSTTGAKKDFSDEQQAYFEKLQGMKLRNPFLIGFGVSSHSTFLKACRFGSGAIVGSAFISLLKSSTDVAADVPRFIKELRG
ncbi:MAG TPA: tryptophan synthase subunit alpha, partial [Cyclobacteriaceae bacterium]|nr:tryptophan synthase subunit alpha [Cyclobacteriaceae bacterium]